MLSQLDVVIPCCCHMTPTDGPTRITSLTDMLYTIHVCQQLVVFRNGQYLLPTHLCHMHRKNSDLHGVKLLACFKRFRHS